MDPVYNTIKLSDNHFRPQHQRAAIKESREDVNMSKTQKLFWHLPWPAKRCFFFLIVFNHREWDGTMCRRGNISGDWSLMLSALHKIKTFWMCAAFYQSLLLPIHSLQNQITFNYEPLLFSMVLSFFFFSFLKVRSFSH